MTISLGKTNNYTLGAGKVYFNLFPDEDPTRAKGFRYLGSTSEFNLTQESDTLEHKNSEGGMIYTDEEIPISTTMSGTLTTDNIVPENLALFYMGEHAVMAQTAASAQSETMTVHRGTVHKLGVTRNNPNGIFAVENVVVTVVAGGAALVRGTDFEIDEKHALLSIDINTAKIDAAAGTEIKVQYDAKAAKRDVILSKSKSIVGALRFVSDNGTGTNREYYIPKARLTPNGDHALKGEEWQTLGFNVKALKLDDNTPTMFINGTPVV